MAEQGKYCPMMVAGGNMQISGSCIGPDCAWWCDFANDCSVSLLAGMFADSTICQNVFENNSSVEAEPVRHAHWEYGNDGYGNEHYYCTLCHNDALNDDDGEYCLSHRCPHCALMDEEVQDDV